MKKLILLFVVILFTNSCKKDDSPIIEENTLELPKVAIVDVSDDSEWDYWVVTKDDYFFIKEENGMPDATYYYNSSVKKSYTIFYNSDGMLDRLQVEGYTFLFKNYHDNKVDMAVIYPDVRYEIIENIVLPEEFDSIYPIDILKTKDGALLKSSEASVDVLKAAARVAGAAGCAVSTFSALATGGLAIPLAVLSCGSLAASFTVDYIDVMNSIGGDQKVVDSRIEFVNEHGSKLSVFLDCGIALAGNPVDVVSCVADIASLTFDKAAEDRTSILEIRNSISTVGLFYEGFAFTVTPGLIDLAGGFNFGEVNIGETKRTFFVIRNKLPGTIHIDGIELPTGYTAEWTTGDIAPYGEKNVFVNFTPTTEGDLSGTIKVKSAYNNVSNEIAVDGFGKGVPYNEMIIGRWKNGSTGCYDIITFSSSSQTQSSSCNEYLPYTARYSITGNRINLDGYSIEIVSLNNAYLITRAGNGNTITWQKF